MGVLAMSLVSASVQAQTSFLGVLERGQCAEDAGIHARVMFASKAGQWQTLEGASALTGSELTARNWQIVRSGNVLGAIALERTSTAYPPAGDWRQNRDTLYLPSGTLPEFGMAEPEWGSWCANSGARPFVLVSPTTSGHRTRFWLPTKPSQDMLNKAYQAFRVTLQGKPPLNCRDENDEHAEVFDFSQLQTRVVESYRSQQGDALVAIGLDPRLYRCDGPSDSTWSPQWYWLHSGQATWLGANMNLLDSGDFSGDGRNETLFWFTSYNQDGYVLYADGMRRRLEYLWNYH